MIITHESKLTLPIAMSPLSKKKMIPRKEKNIPKPVRPRPISDKNGNSEVTNQCSQERANCSIHYKEFTSWNISSCFQHQTLPSVALSTSTYPKEVKFHMIFVHSQNTQKVVSLTSLILLRHAKKIASKPSLTKLLFKILLTEQWLLDM